MRAEDVTVDVEAYALLERRLARSPEEHARALADTELDEIALAALRGDWDQKFAADPAVEEAFLDAFPEPEAPAKAAPSEVAPPQPPQPATSYAPIARVGAPSREASPWAVVPEGMRHFTDQRGTQLAPDVPAGPALPFQPAVAPSSFAKADLESLVPVGMRHFRGVGSTELAPDVPAGPALPFQPAVAPSSVAETDLASLVPVGMRHFTDLRGTQLAPDVPAGPVLPFQPAVAPSSFAKADLASLVPVGMRHFTDLHGTQLAPDVPAGPALPFVPAAPSMQATPIPVGGETTDISAIVAAIPPPIKSAVTPAVAAPPARELSVEQYASLCVELEVYVTQRAAVLVRYGFTEAQWRQLDARWRAWMATDVRARSAWEKACATYRQWLIAPRG